MRSRRRRVLKYFALGLVVVIGVGAGVGYTLTRLHDTPAEATIDTADVGRFLVAMDSLHGASNRADSLATLDRLYLSQASPGLKAFLRARIGSGDALLDQIAARPAYYSHLSLSLGHISEHESGILSAFARFASIYPAARFADVSLVIGRMNSGGTTSPRRILIGAEMYGLDSAAPRHELSDWERSVLRANDMVPTIVTHELMHLLQRRLWRGNLLEQALREGGADFVAELVTGRNINAHVHEWATRREAALWQEFRAAMTGRELSAWFGNASVARPADLGYFIGYRIAQAYYDQSSDKVGAIHDILRVRDAEAFLVASGYDGDR